MTGKDGVGVYGEGNATYEKKNENGFKTGAVAGLTGGATANVTEVPGTDPKQYDISVTITFGASATLSTGYGKEGDDKSAGASATLGASGTFSRSHRMSAEEANAYVERLKASNGGSPAGPEKEMAVLAALAARGPDAAREVAEGAKAALGSAEALDKMATGDKVNASVEGTAGGKVNASAGGIGVEGGIEESRSIDVSVEKKDGGKVEYTKQVGDKEKISGGANANIGIVEGGIGFSKTSKSAHGYKFSLDPKDPHFDAGSPEFVVGYATAVAELGAATTQAELDAFAGKYAWTVLEKTTVTGEGSGDKASIGIGPVKAGMTSNSSIEDTQTTDASGKLKERTVVGQSGGGASVSVPVLGEIGGSVNDKAVATIDGDGNASLDVSETRKDTNMAKLLESKHIPGTGAAKDESKSTLAKVTGGGEKADTDDTHVEGIGANGGDLKALAWAAAHGEWMKHCPVPRLMDDWREAGKEVVAEGCTEAACAAALAKFVGKGGPGREAVVDEAIRYGTGGGTRYEFPEGLTHLKGPYAELVQANVVATVEAAAKDKGAAAGVDAAKAYIGRLESLQNEIRSNETKFEDASRFGEMIGTITDRITKLENKVRELNGGKPDELSKKDWQERYNRLLTDCMDFKNTENGFFGKIDDCYGSSGHAGLSDRIELEKYRSQLRELYERWDPKYSEMAGIAQDQGFGADTYWKYKPDRARWEKSAQGKAGEETPPVPETKDYSKKEKVVRAPADPVGDGEREVKQMQAASANKIQGQINGARMAASGAYNGASKKMATASAAAKEEFERGRELFNNAEKQYQSKLTKGASEDDWNAYGFIAMEDFNNAKEHFKQASSLA